MVLVYGDTTTTLGGALAAAKRDIPVAHVEAGLRSFVRSMPEEQNRVVTDHLSELLFVPTDTAVANLAREGITAGVHKVGDVMYDAALLFAPVAARREGAAAFGLAAGGYVLATVHRAAATDTPEALAALVEVLGAIGEPTVFPVHPRTRHKLEEAGLWSRLESVPGLHLAPPVGYLDFTALLVGARAVVTDSGGVQKEAYFHGVPCITLRNETEWVETVDGGFNRLTGMDAAKVAAALGDRHDPRGPARLLRRRTRLHQDHRGHPGLARGTGLRPPRGQDQAFPRLRRGRHLVDLDPAEAGDERPRPDLDEQIGVALPLRPRPAPRLDKVGDAQSRGRAHDHPGGHATPAGHLVDHQDDDRREEDRTRQPDAAIAPVGPGLVHHPRGREARVAKPVPEPAGNVQEAAHRREDCGQKREGPCASGVDVLVEEPLDGPPRGGRAAHRDREHPAQANLLGDARDPREPRQQRIGHIGYDSESLSSPRHPQARR